MDISDDELPHVILVRFRRAEHGGQAADFEAAMSGEYLDYDEDEDYDDDDDEDLRDPGLIGAIQGLLILVRNIIFHPRSLDWRYVGMGWRIHWIRIGRAVMRLEL